MEERKGLLFFFLKLQTLLNAFGLSSLQLCPHPYHPHHRGTDYNSSGNLWKDKLKWDKLKLTLPKTNCNGIKTPWNSPTCCTWLGGKALFVETFALTTVLTGDKSKIKIGINHLPYITNGKKSTLVLSVFQPCLRWEEFKALKGFCCLEQASELWACFSSFVERGCWYLPQRWEIRKATNSATCFTLFPSSCLRSGRKTL